MRFGGGPVPGGRGNGLAAILGLIRIHHVGIVVRNAEAAAKTYRAGQGLDVLAVEDYP
jgi:hypothetical protein